MKHRLHSRAALLFAFGVLASGCLNSPPPDAKRELFAGTSPLIKCLKADLPPRTDVQDQKWSMERDEVQLVRDEDDGEFPVELATFAIFRDADRATSAMRDEKEFFANTTDGDGRTTSNDYQRKERAQEGPTHQHGAALVNYWDRIDAHEKRLASDCVEQTFGEQTKLWPAPVGAE